MALVRVRTVTSWWVLAPPTLVMSYQTIVPSMSSAPDWSMSWAMGRVCMIQKDLTWGKLSSMSREMARVRRFSRPAGPGRCSSSLPSGKKGRGDDGLEIAGDRVSGFGFRVSGGGEDQMFGKRRAGAGERDDGDICAFVA